MKKVLIAIFGLILAGNAVGADWVELSQDKDKILYFDKDNVKKDNYLGKPIVGAWTKVQFKKNNKDNLNNGKYIKNVLLFYWVSCPERTISEPSDMAMYDEAGNSLDSENIPMYRIKFKQIIPDTLQEGIYIGACYGAFRQDMRQLGDNPTSYELDKLVKEYPIQIKEMQEDLKKYTPKPTD